MLSFREPGVKDVSGMSGKPICIIGNLSLMED